VLRLQSPRDAATVIDRLKADAASSQARDERAL